MRVVAGTLGGRTFEAPRSRRTHPMGDKVRGALFNVLGDVEGLRVLDAYAGSGAISIEAISRGAISAVAIDVDSDACKTMLQNVTALGLVKDIKVIRTNATSWSANNPHELFDVVVLDPPYDAVHSAALQQLADHAKDGAVTVLSLPPKAVVELVGHELLVTKQYGDAELRVYRRLPST